MNKLRHAISDNNFFVAASEHLQTFDFFFLRSHFQKFVEKLVHIGIFATNYFSFRGDMYPLNTQIYGKKIINTYSKLHICFLSDCIHIITKLG